MCAKTSKKKKLRHPSPALQQPEIATPRRHPRETGNLLPGLELQTVQVSGCYSSRVSTACLTQLFSHVSRDHLFFISSPPWSGLQGLAGRDTVDRGGQHPVDDTKSCPLASACTCMCTHVRGHTPIRSKWCVSQM